MRHLLCGALRHLNIPPLIAHRFHYNLTESSDGIPPQKLVSVSSPHDLMGSSSIYNKCNFIIFFSF